VRGEGRDFEAHAACQSDTSAKTLDPPLSSMQDAADALDEILAEVMRDRD
jgi:hypothetical protein